MGAGSKIWIRDRDDPQQIARVVNGRLLVSSTGGGGGGDVNIAEVGGVAIGATVPVSGTLAVTQSTSPWVVSGTVAVSSVVPGTGATNLGKEEDTAHTSGDVGVMALAVINDGPAGMADPGDYSALSLDREGRLYVSCLQEDSVTISSIVPGTGNTQLGKAEDDSHASGSTGVMALAVRQDTLASSVSANNDYGALKLNSLGALYTEARQATHNLLNGTVRVQDGNGSNLLDLMQTNDTSPTTPVGPTFMMFYPSDLPAPNEGDWTHATCDGQGNLRVVIDNSNPFDVSLTSSSLGIDVVDAAAQNSVMMAGAVRSDTPSSIVDTDGDATNLIVDAVGALWTRPIMPAKEALSESTDGLPIQITGTNTGTANDLHVTTASEFDQITIDLTNTSGSAVVATIEFGGTGDGNELDITVPANATVRAVNKAVIGGSATTRTISAYAATGSVLNAVGFVERGV